MTFEVKKQFSGVLVVEDGCTYARMWAGNSCCWYDVTGGGFVCINQINSERLEKEWEAFHAVPDFEPDNLYGDDCVMSFSEQDAIDAEAINQHITGVLAELERIHAGEPEGCREDAGWPFPETSQAAQDGERSEGLAQPAAKRLQDGGHVEAMRDFNKGCE